MPIPETFPSSRISPLGLLGIAGLAATGAVAATGLSGSPLAVAPLSLAAALLGYAALSKGRVIDPAPTADAPGIPVSRDAFVSLARLRGGLSMVGPEEARHGVLGRMLDHATASGMDFVVLSLGARPTLCDLAHASALRHGSVDALTLVDASAAGGFSHALDALAAADADAVVRLVSACCPGLSDASPESARSRGLLTALVHCLVDLRDERVLDLTPALLSNHLNLLKLIDLSDSDAYPMLRQRSRKRMLGYLHSLPGYQQEKRYKQAQVAMDRHSQAEARISDGLAWLTGANGAALTTPYGDVTLATACEPGRRLVLHVPLAPHEAGPSAFLLQCLAEAVRVRDSDRPLLVVADGFDARLDALADVVLGLRAPGILLVTGVTDATGKAARLIEWAPTRLLLPGCATDAPDAPGRRALGTGRAVAVIPGRSRAFDPDVPDAVPRRGRARPRIGFSRPRPDQVDDPSRTLADNLLNRLLAPAAADGVPSDSVIPAAAEAFRDAQRSPDAPAGGIAGAAAAIATLSRSPVAES